MRFRHLHLIRYGSFKDRLLDFPAGDGDFQLIYGSNEAGKSTTRDAVSDLLFGFEQRNPYGFLHDLSSLRIGAELEHDKQKLKFERKKGNRETLRDMNDEALPDSVLALYLGTGDREFFARMFSLNHQQLRSGGREILDAKDDVGRIIFETGSGISGLGNALTGLEDEAKGIYSPKRSKDRTYYKAKDLLEDAKKRLRDTTVHAKEWKDRSKEAELITTKQSELREQLSVKSAKRQKLERIRRVRPILAEFERYSSEMNELGTTRDFPDTAETTLSEAETEMAKAQSHINSTTNLIMQDDKVLEKLEVDEAFIQREPEIRALKEENPVILKNMMDIPKRKLELGVCQAKIQALLEKVGEEPLSLGQLEDRLPDETTIKTARTLIEGWGRIESEKENADRTVASGRSAISRLENRLNAGGPSADTDNLEAAIRVARERGDLRGSVTENENRVSQLKAEVGIILSEMEPWKGQRSELEKLKVPGRAKIREYEPKFRDIEDRYRELKQRIAETESDLEQAALNKNQAIRDDKAIAAEEVEKARERRKLGWDLVRGKYIDDRKVPEKEIKEFSETGELADVFEDAVEAADEISDRRFEQADGSAQLVQMNNDIEKKKTHLTALKRNGEVLANDEKLMLKEWHALWKLSKIIPETPAVMLEWLEKLEKFRGLVKDTEDLLRQIDHLRDNTSSALESLREALSALGKQGETFESKSLNVVIEECALLKEKLAAHATEKTTLKNQLSERREELEDAEAAARNADAGAEAWRETWRKVLALIRREADEDIEPVRGVLNAWEDLRVEHRKAADISDRITKMEADISIFDQRVTEFARDAASDLADLGSREMVIKLGHRLAKMETKKTEKRTLEQQKTHQEGELNRFKQEYSAAKAKMGSLFKIAETDDIDTLRDAIRINIKSKKLQGLKEEKLSQLATAGDGKDPEELKEECETLDPDTDQAQIEELDRALKEINDELQGLSAAAVKAKAHLDEISGGSDAIEAEEDQQHALAEMEVQAEKYVKIKSASMLLRWAIDRYRKEKQAPLFERASNIFSQLTAGSFESLTLDYDDKDKPQIIGIRPDQRHVGVGGMSDGTTDQLYLALRVAAIENYLEKAPPLPFIADDLFINFDDERSTAGLEVLADLSKHTQVLFFSHHQHLIELAEKNIASEKLSIHHL